MKKLFSILVLGLSVLLCGAYMLPLPAVPSALKIPAERADYVALHFWDSLGTVPPDSLGCGVWQQAVADFLSVFPHMSSDDVRGHAAQQLVDLGRGDDANAACISSALETCLFEVNSPQHDERLFADFLQRMTAAAYPDSMRSAWLLEMVSKNLPGTKAPDFEFTGRDGKRHTLYNSLACPTILCFYDPYCDDCHRTVAEMAGDIILNSRIERGAASVLAITVADEDAWRVASGVLPPAWTDGHNDGSIDSLFLINSYPSLYLLNAEGIIVAKDAPYSQIISLLTAM